MKCLLSVCLGVLAGVAVFGLNGRGQAPALQKGVSVEMAVTENASPMAAADDATAWIVAVTRDGSLFFGTEKVTPECLAEAMKQRPHHRDQKLYIKADARAPFADVQRALQAGRTDWFDTPVLLTAQTEQAVPGTIVPPRGLEVEVGAAAGPGAIAVRVSKAKPRSPRLTVNGADVADGLLASTLRSILQSRAGKVVELQADGRLPFAQIAHVIDMCRGAGLKVAVAGPEV